MDESLLEEEEVTLADVIHRDRDLYKEVCESYVDLFRVALKILDAEGRRLLDIPYRSDVCQYVYGIPPCRQACRDIVLGIRQDALQFRRLEHRKCFTGAEYRLAPIHHETEVIGKVVFGPFLPRSVQEIPEAFVAMHPGVDAQVAWQKTLRFQRIDAGTADRIAQTLATVVEVMSFVGFKGQMTTDMHVRSITEAYAELSNANRELRTQNERLERQAKQRSDFLQAVSQELRVPMTNVIGQTEMLLEGFGGDLTEMQREFLETAMSESEQMSLVTQMMEELSNVEQNRVELSTEPIPAELLLMAAVDQAQKNAATRGVEVDFDSPQLALPEIYVDEEKANSTVAYVVDNAIKFNRSGGTVELALVADNAETGATLVGIQVRDTGIGIAQNDLERIFEPFYQAHSGQDRVYAGTGIGLTIARAYVNRMGGRIDVESTPDVGSTFTIWFPTTVV